MAKKERKTEYMNYEFKFTDEEKGIFQGWGNRSKMIDDGQDVVEPGAWKKTIKDNGPKRILLYMHYRDLVAGSITVEDKEDGLWIEEGKLYLDEPRIKTYYHGMKDGTINSLSVGFWPVSVSFKKDESKNEIRHIHEAALKEVSLVPITMPMNDQSLITSIKSDEDFHAYIIKNKEDDTFRDKCFSLFGVRPEDLHLFLEKNKPLDEPTPSIVEPGPTPIEQGPSFLSGVYDKVEELNKNGGIK